MIGRYRALRRAGLLGINERNVRLVNELNPRRLIRLVDDKRETKRLANAANIPTPELYGVIANPFHMRHLESYLDKPDGVVIKPANGSQGNGIQVLMEPMRGGWRRSNGQRALLEDIRFHVNNILSGMYSLPTAESDGKANLHKGGVGVGLDLVTGKTLSGMQNGKTTDIHPDTANPLRNFSVPHWDTMLEMAAKAYDVTGLGYLGADIVLDKTKGPLLLELNARPGLAIQVANRIGIRPLLNATLKADIEGMDALARVELAKKLYRNHVPEPTF